jgi:hypothetical protein
MAALSFINIVKYSISMMEPNLAKWYLQTLHSIVEIADMQWKETTGKRLSAITSLKNAFIIGCTHATWEDATMNINVNTVVN